MSAYLSFSLSLVLTLAACLTLTTFLGKRMFPVLLDLCGTEDRARFWTTFSNILLVGLPIVVTLKFQPTASTLEDSFFEVIGRFGSNLVVFLVMLICIGILISFFALVAPRTKVDAR